MKTKYAACAFIVHPIEDKVLAVTRGATKLCGLPGGKMEEGESYEEAALRELLEETGLVGESAKLLFISHVDTRFAVATFSVMVTSGTIRDSKEGHVFWATPIELCSDESSPFASYNRHLFAHIRDKGGLSHYRTSTC